MRATWPRPLSIPPLTCTLSRASGCPGIEKGRTGHEVTGKGGVTARGYGGSQGDGTVWN